MRGVKVLTALLAAGALSLSATIALAAASPAPEGTKAPEAPKATATPKARKGKETGADRVVRGEVAAVEPSANPMTLTMKSKEGKEELTVGVDVTDKTIIREGKVRKSLADIKVGDRVWMRYERTDGKLAADYIRILKPTRTAPRREHSEKREEYEKSEPAGKTPASTLW